jgi:hypothetical protein
VLHLTWPIFDEQQAVDVMGDLELRPVVATFRQLTQIFRLGWHGFCKAGEAELKEFNEMSRGWYGYLVRALNEFASITAQCATSDISRGFPARAKISAERRSRQPRQKKACNTASRRRSR